MVSVVKVAEEKGINGRSNWRERTCTASKTAFRFPWITCYLIAVDRSRPIVSFIYRYVKHFDLAGPTDSVAELLVGYATRNKLYMTIKPVEGERILQEKGGASVKVRLLNLAPK